MDNLKGFIEFSKKYFSVGFLEIHLDQKFSSLHATGRQNIRRDIVEKYRSQLSDSEREYILDLNHLPKSKTLYFSISHCPDLGGYAVADRQVGFDLEIRARITERLVSRISTAEEIKKCPEFQYIWVAKEAVLKLMKPGTLVSSIQIQNWTRTEFSSVFSADAFKGTVHLMDKKYLISVAV
jgi:4'-phosphopantetheinyl transferase superfamily